MESFCRNIASAYRMSPDHRDRTEEVLAWVVYFSQIWNHKLNGIRQCFTDHGTFIVGFCPQRNII